MSGILTRNWRLVAVRGVLAIIFGLFALFHPAIALGALVFVFGIYACIDGIALISSALANRGAQPHWVAVLIGGIVGIIAGVIAFMEPGVTAAAFVFLIAIWAIVMGISEIVAAIRLRKEIGGEWLLALAGVLSVAFGLVLFSRPGAGALVLVIWLGVYALMFGVVLLALALRLRQWNNERPDEQMRNAA